MKGGRGVPCALRCRILGQPTGIELVLHEAPEHINTHTHLHICTHTANLHRRHMHTTTHTHTLHRRLSGVNEFHPGKTAGAQNMHMHARRRED